MLSTDAFYNWIRAVGGKKVAEPVMATSVSGVFGCFIAYPWRSWYTHENLKTSRNNMTISCYAKLHCSGTRYPLANFLVLGLKPALKNAAYAKASFVAPYLVYGKEEKLKSYTLSALSHSVMTYGAIMRVLISQQCAVGNHNMNPWSGNLLRRNAAIFFVYIAWANSVTFEAYEKSKKFTNSNNEKETLAFKVKASVIALPVASAVIIPAEMFTNKILVCSIKDEEQKIRSKHSLFKPIDPEVKRPPSPIIGPSQINRDRSASLAPLLPQVKSAAVSTIIASLRRAICLFGLRVLWKTVENGTTLVGAEMVHDKLTL